MKTNRKLKEMRKRIVEEKKKNQEEIIKFMYIDKESHTKIEIQDRRKIKVALMEMELKTMIQNDDIRRYECPYNPKSDDDIDDGYEDFVYEESEFEKNLEDALQEAVDKMYKEKENREKLKTFLKKHLPTMSFQEIIIIFFYYYLEISQSDIADFFEVSRQRINFKIKQIEEKLAQKAK